MTRIWLLAAALALAGAPTGVAVVAAILAPLAILGSVVAACTWARGLGWVGGTRPGRRRWRVWWWYGYRGLYPLDWAMKRRRAAS